MKPIRIEIISPVHNRREDTLRCIKSLKRSNVDGIEAHIIIVDDGSTDGTAEAIRELHPDVEIIEGDGNLWYTAGTNRGLDAALGHDPDYILAVNDDSIFNEDCIRFLVDCAEKYPRSVIGPLLLEWDTPHRIFQVSPKWDMWGGGFRHWRKQTVWTVPARPWEVEIIVGNCVLYPTDVVKELGFMDEKRLVQYGDAEYTPRMRRAGWKLLIEPRARVFCKPNVVITGFRKLPISQKINEVFRKPTGPYSLHRRIYTTLGSAPNRVEGLIAIPIFFIRFLLGKSIEGKWAANRPERPLAESFAGRVVPEKDRTS